MFTKYVLPLLAVAGLGFSIYTVVQARRVPPPTPPIQEPPVRPPTFRSIAGAGIIEAKRRNIPIGAPVPGLVMEVMAREGDEIVEGDPLFRLNTRALEAERLVAESSLAASKAELAKLRQAPRTEDVPPAEAAVAEARARVARTEAEADRSGSLYGRGVGTPSDYDRDRYSAAESKAALAKAQSELDRLRKGTWEPDLEIARAAVARAEADLTRVAVEIDRHTVRALAEGKVLQVNALPGQYASNSPNSPMIVLGDVEDLHVRVDIDEQDVPLFRVGGRAVATLKGRPGVRFDLEFVRVDPYVIPKRNLTGDNAERVDTRVLQVIYALPPDRPLDLYVGQQMDAYLEAAEPSGIDLDVDPDAPRPFEDSTKDSNSETPERDVKGVEKHQSE